MEQRLSDKKWRLRNSWWVLLALFPWLDCLAFFHIGYKAKRRSWTLVGAVVAALWLAYSICWIAAGASVGFTRSYGFLRWLLYAAALALALVWRGSYLKLTALRQSREPRPHALLSDTRWKITNSLWMLWGLLPGIGIFGFIHAGSRTHKRGCTALGVFISLLLAVLLALSRGGIVLPWIKLNLGYDAWSAVKNSLLPSVSTLLYAAQLYLIVMQRRPYLDAVAPSWAETREKYACLRSAKWRALNSWWILPCFVPYCSGVGLIAAGAMARRRSWLLFGAGVSLLIAALAVLGSYVQNGAFGELTFAQTIEVSDSYFILRCCLSFICIAVSTIIREPFLVARAKQMGGYESAVDRELAAQETFQRHMSGERTRPTHETPSKEAPEPPKKQRLITVDTPEPPGAVGAVTDVNSCSEAELRALPGLTLAQAKQAMEYRAAHGGFVSVDEFVDVLEIKPHFAAGIFRLAKASSVEKPPDAEKKAVRRRIDI